MFAPPRTLANVLADLREARRDWEDALSDAERGDPDADDRATEADNRIDELRSEFADRFRWQTGITWKQVEQAVSEAVL
jgi:hypothetical protein